MTVQNYPQRPLSLVLPLAAALLLATAALSAALQPPSSRPTPSNNYTPIPGFLLTADSKPTPQAKFFHSKGRGTVLIHNQNADLAFVVNSRSGRVAVFSASDFLALDTGELEPLAGKRASKEITLKRIDRRPAFTHASVEYRVSDKPALLGPRTATQIFADDAYYQVAAKKYKPTATYIAQLKAYPTKTKITVFFGSWCQNCHKWLPNILRVQEALAGSNISFEYYGLPQGFADPIAEQRNVRSVPFGIMYQDGKEFARISGPSWTFPDLQLVRQLGL